MQWSNLMPQLKNVKIPLIATYLMVLGTCVSCGGHKDKSEEIKKEPEPVTVIPGCYLMTIDKDSAMLVIQLVGNRASGTLTYHPSGRNSNEGKFSGNIVKDTLYGWYEDHSDDMISIREIKIKILKDGFAEGYGGFDIKQDTAFFKYPYTLKYEEDHPYRKINCP